MVGTNPNLDKGVWACDDVVSLAGMVKGVHEKQRQFVAGRSEWTIQEVRSVAQSRIQRAN